MNEEIKREAELSEAALENVSGGDMTTPTGKAIELCSWCKTSSKRGNCGHSKSELIAYLKKHGVDSIGGAPQTCPFYNE